MRYYFFVTSEQMRGGNMKPTLRALPGQTFPDGTPVDDTFNVQAPKEPGTSPNGTRFEYPTGTYFCSNHLELDASKATAFYTVYDSSKGQSPTGSFPYFFPVSDNPNFKYVSPAHKNDVMNAAFLAFKTFGSQEFGEEEPKKKTRKKLFMKKLTSPAGPDGKSNPIAKGTFEPVYDGQIDTETELVASWMKRILREKSIVTFAKRPKCTATTMQMMEDLYTAGESLDTITSRIRFDEVMKQQKTSPSDMAIIACGPLEWYLNALITEHNNKADTTSSERTSDPTSIGDVAFIVCTEYNNISGNTDTTDNTVLQHVKRAIEDGWTVDELIKPERLSGQPNLVTYVEAVATGIIPKPEPAGGAGNSIIDQKLKDKRFKRPDGKEGFYVDEKTWKALVACIVIKGNAMLLGPSGSGKTEVVRLLCKQAGIPFTLIPMGNITDPTAQLVGKMDITPTANGGMETKFDWADFALAIQRPGVVLLDEINRIPRNGFNILFSVLDGTRELNAGDAKSTDQRTIKVHPDCIFFATANVGQEFTGTSEIDEAMITRFGLNIRMNYLDIKTEANVLVQRVGIKKEDAVNIATVANNIRLSKKNDEITHSVSMRETLAAAQLVKIGFDVEEALETIFVPRFDDDDRGGGRTEAGIVKAHIASRFNSNA